MTSNTETPFVATIGPCPVRGSPSASSASEHQRQSPSFSEAVRNANSKMQNYEKYVEELYRRHPETFHSLNHFIKRGDCERPERGTCKCSDRCACYNSKECRCSEDNSKFHCYEVKHKVRVYDIHPREKKWEEFLTPGQAYYDATDLEDFRKLQEKLSSKIEADDGNKETREPGYPESPPCRLITVNHLSPNVAKLLGGMYDIPADFFNQHLPGTEAISGRLISRLSSSVQIDFDELYESTYTFDELWPGRDIIDGHQIIREAIEQNFLFQDVGWDYLPVGKKDWDQDLINKEPSSGYEFKKSRKQKRLKNVFQFNLTHCISVYSKPPGHPDTAIILFYPRLPICHRQDHFDADGTHIPGLTTPHDQVYFRSIPDTVPKMSDILSDISYLAKKKLHDTQKRPSMEASYDTLKYKGGFKWDYAAAYDWEFRVHLEEHFNKRNKTDAEQSVQCGKNGLSGKKNAGDSGKEQSFDAAEKRWNKEHDHATFVYLFGIPLFEIVAANWARLVDRERFDLDLLEWRPIERMQKKTVEEIKSRRIAITKHQRDIAASIEVLQSLTQEERYGNISHKHHNGDQTNPKSRIDGLKLALMETSAVWNRGRSNGLVAEEVEDDSWERVFYDFVELQASMEFLEKRAKKIQDGIFGLLSVKIQDGVWSLLSVSLEEQQRVFRQQSDFLNAMLSFVSLAVVPFTVAGSIFSVDFTSGGPPKNPAHFAIAMVVTFFVIVAGYSFIYYAADYKIFPRFLSALREFLSGLTDRFRLGKKKNVDYVEDGRRRLDGTEYV